ncbi:hypothetical protein U879_14710 [Defluviimonas sp. 20V17]|uniref:Uncharacterized conserved protein, DUF924 family n=1 Tax=Allgaiera indica TaxID=765699 RepID=A0AAN4ZZ38_9RHOB|nr:DUF924 family protein [Allgaiera indica]KDB02926.1 hypothetical protein U879_14710 [Defluviimonas sp. 20V17]GHE01470.1 hypothetical protein GCM10008024_17070 [Allgaiera indica]SDW87330.1 Uncharacterized conserved protein, DUF924 family [Allgaiera indica]
MTHSYSEVLDYWLSEVGPKGWYAGGEALDAEIRGRFAALCGHAWDGALTDWISGPEPALAYLIVTDQFPRNIWRGSDRAFATDAKARMAADAAMRAGWDMQVPEPQRQFFYLPLMHHEDPDDQARCVALIAERMPKTGADNLIHARAHQEVIRRFGRFPHRNAALGRTSSREEVDFLENGGYAQILQALKARDPGAR